MGLWLLTRPLGFIFRPIGLLMKGDFRGLFALLLGFALLGGLWELGLYSLSTQGTATAVMTEAGVAVINPALGSMGVGPTMLSAIQANAATHPNDPVDIPGLKSSAIGLTKQDLVGLTFDQATRKIYGNVAKTYYASGPDAVFALSVPTISLLPDTHLDWLAALGLSATTLTAHGHAQTQQLALWLWGAVALLGLLVLVLSAGWARLYALSQAIFTGAVPGLALIGVVWFLWQRAPGVFGPFATLLNLIGGAFVPVYLGAGVAAVAALIAGSVGSAVAKGAAAARKVRRTPVPVGAGRSAQPAASAASVFSNMGGSAMGGAPMGGSAMGNGSASYGARPYGQRQAYGQVPAAPGYGQGQPYGQTLQYQPRSSYSQDPSYGGVSSGSQYGGQSLASPAGPAQDLPPIEPIDPMGVADQPSDAWLSDQPAYPPQAQPRGAYPDYRRYQQSSNPSPYQG
jgi:hypothetical protein